MSVLSPWYSAVIGVLGYSLLAGVGIAWAGISLANWLGTRRRCSVFLGLGAGCGAILVTGLAIISSDLLPQFSGPAVALAMRVSGLLSGLCFATFTALYLRAKRRQKGRC